MTLNSPKSLTGVMAVPRSRSSIVVVIGAMALFLVAASFFLASYPFTVSSQQYLQGGGHVVIEEVSVGDGEDTGTGDESGSAFGAESDSGGRKVKSGSNGRADVGMGSGPKAKVGLDSDTNLSSDEKKDAGMVDGGEVLGGSISGTDISSGASGDVRTGVGSEAKDGSKSGTDLSSDGRKDVGMDDGSELKGGYASGTDISSDASGDVGMRDGSEAKGGSVSNVREDVGIGERSEVKSGSSSDARKDITTDDSSEVKSGLVSGSDLSSIVDVGTGGDGSEAKGGLGDGSVSLDRSGDVDIDKGNLSGSEAESEKLSSGTDDDESSPLDATKEVLVIPSESVNNSSTAESCDLYQGKWIYDPVGPLYTNNTCPILTQMQNCQGNLRPDKDYENYRWKPYQCDLPHFSPRKFLELMRGKTLAFIGDSVARNQMESMLCILWQEETPKNRGNRRMQRWFFRSTSTMIVRIWSSWLVHQDGEALDFAPAGLTKVHLDVPDETFMEFLPSFDVVVLSSGHWFAKKSAYVLNKKVVGGQLWWPKDVGDMKVNNIEAFGISVETSMTAIANDPNFKGLAIVRSYSPDHYEGGAWNTGGSCTGKIKPLSEVVRNGFTDVMHDKQVTGFQRAVTESGSGGSKLKLMDITEVFGYRADGHPGPYRSPDPNKKTKRGPHGEPPPQDCLHWCMPGPVDTWNEMLLEIIRREYEGA